LIRYQAATPDEVDGDERFWALYDSAFPANEREPREVILNAARAGVGLIVRARRGDETVGLASGHQLKDPPALFLVYLAVDAELRGQGVGHAIFEEVWRHAPGRMIWEVDPPQHASDPAERQRRLRRIAFFSAVGGHAIARPYAQPPLTEGAEPVPMLLMGRPEADHQLVEKLVHAIYFEKYGAQNRIPESVLRALL
jgi:GNAT superfamily N-acetyltransferase